MIKKDGVAFYKLRFDPWAEVKCSEAIGCGLIEDGDNESTFKVIDVHQYKIRSVGCIEVK